MADNYLSKDLLSSLMLALSKNIYISLIRYNQFK